MTDQTSEETIAETVFLMGTFSYEGMYQKMHSLGYKFIKKTFQSTPKNWYKFMDLIELAEKHNKCVAIFIYMHSDNLIYSCTHEFIKVWERFMPILERHKSIIFIYQDNAFGEFHHRGLYTDEELEQKFENMKSRISSEKIQEWYLADKAERDKRQEGLRPYEEASIELLEFLSAHDIELFPFTQRNEIIQKINETLDEVSQGIFLRLYVPHGRYQSEQLNGFLRLFEKYLQEVEGKLCAVDTIKTSHGLTYVFKSKDSSTNLSDMDTAIQRFDHFMEICRNDPQQAENILGQLGLGSVDALAIVSRYTRDYQRIIMDTRHEMEQKKLLLNQRLESEVFEIVNARLLPEAQVNNPSSLLSLAGNSGPVVINFPGVSIQNTTFIEQMVNGDITYTENDRLLLDIFDKYAERLSAIQLKSELQQLKDESVTPERRTTAKKNIISFLSKAASKIGEGAVDISVKVLVAYVDSLMKSANS